MQIKRLKRCGRLKMYIINTLKHKLSTAKTYEHNLIDERPVVDRHRCHMAAKVGVFVAEEHSKLPTLYWLPKVHKRPYKSRFLLILAHALILRCL